MPFPGPDKLSAAHARAFASLGRAMQASRDPWCLIGGAAALLHGVPVDPLNDIDVLLSERDARTVLAALATAPLLKPASNRFRSRLFGRWNCAGLAVEFMAGFAVFSAGSWVEVPAEPAETVDIGGAVLHLPSIATLIAMHRLFGRDKDAGRIDALNALALPDLGTP